ncbi:MAG: hypothetical protein KDE27_06480 [Planctomycetes bacterium]|nr:hypothetical protein [Planctomycetota bacterium]
MSSARPPAVQRWFRVEPLPPMNVLGIVVGEDEIVLAPGDILTRMHGSDDRRGHDPFDVRRIYT